MLDTTADKASELEEIAHKLAKRLGSAAGVQAMAKAVEETRQRAAKTSKDARLDPELLRKRVTF